MLNYVYLYVRCLHIELTANG